MAWLNKKRNKREKNGFDTKSPKEIVEDWCRAELRKPNEDNHESLLMWIV